ncbi:MAG: hypothetical protein IJ762_05495 [Bacteroidaceae bacterium]|nr:hypothetical protein [Bacteroidaceae bacterium]MBR1788625.1 hypothetical protein [Bacteroidaceae bacterium]
MKRLYPIRRFLMLAVLMFSAAIVMADRQPLRRLHRDSLTLAAAKWDERVLGRMAQSVYPVRLSVKGRSLRVTSKHEQVLPIYTQGGTLYIAMQLTPGVNWLYGLPRGRYLINNRPINIK